MSRAVAEVLRRAKERIGTPERWCQKDFRCGDKVCPVEAIRESGGSWEERFALARVVGRTGYLTTDEIARWNDVDGRTHAEVMAAFDRAIAAEEAEEGEKS